MVIIFKSLALLDLITVRISPIDKEILPGGRYQVELSHHNSIPLKITLMGACYTVCEFCNALCPLLSNLNNQDDNLIYNVIQMHSSDPVLRSVGTISYEDVLWAFKFLLNRITGKKISRFKLLH